MNFLRPIVVLLAVPLTTGCASLVEGSAPSLRFASARSATWSSTSEDASLVGGRLPLAVDRGVAVDVDQENRLVKDRIRSAASADLAASTQVIVVPGFATPVQTEELHARAKDRLEMALEEYERTGALAILVSGGNVHPPGTPFNEALEMKRYLLSRGVPEDRIAVEPFARNSTTNLRNAGRFMLATGLERALIVTDRGQSFYFGWPIVSTFHVRSLIKHGYVVGSLTRESSTLTRFEPSTSVLARGDDPLDP